MASREAIRHSPESDRALLPAQRRPANDSWNVALAGGQPVVHALVERRRPFVELLTELSPCEAQRGKPTLESLHADVTLTSFC